MLTSYLQAHPGLAFLDLRARAEGQQEEPGATSASVDVVVEGTARLSMTGAGPLPAGATVAEVTVQHIPSPDTTTMTTPRSRQVVIAPATPGAPSFAVAVEDGGEDGDEGVMWPLRAVFKKGAGREANVRAERVADGEEEGQVVYRLVALREIVDGAPLVLA